MPRYLAEPLAFPRARRFGDLFSSASASKAGVSPTTWTFVDMFSRKRASIPIGPYMAISGPKRRDSLYVHAREQVVDWIKSNMLPSAYDSIYFEIVVRGPREALVIAKNNQIIASRWLAMIDPKTIPGYKPGARK